MAARRPPRDGGDGGFGCGGQSFEPIPPLAVPAEEYSRADVAEGPSVAPGVHRARTRNRTGFPVSERGKMQSRTVRCAT